MSHHELYVRSVMSDRLREAALHRRRSRVAASRPRSRPLRRAIAWRPRIA
ncbi:MAG TPA: hypothetical protein VK923_02515 [Euzebyales bacterium]|nr:hypothetical protein [Euzebyales bacterium]